MAQLAPTSLPFELADGRTVRLALSMGGLYRLKQRNKGLYSRVNKILFHGSDDVLECESVLYAAYLGGKNAEELTEDEFMELLPDLTTCIETSYELMAPKKMTASADRLNSAQSENAAE